MTRSLGLLGLLVVIASAARSFVPEGTEALGSGRVLAFGFLLLAAVQAGHVTQHLRLPKLTGFLLAGAIFGPALMAILTPAMLVDLALFKKVAVGLIALLAGCELNVKALSPKLRSIASVTLGRLLIPLVLLWGALFAASLLLPGVSALPLEARAVVCVMLAVVLSTSSPAGVVALLSEQRAAGPLSEMVLSVVVLADLILTFAFTGTLIAVQVIFPDTNGGTSFEALAAHILGSLVIGAFLGVLFSLYIQRVKEWIGLFVFAVLFVVAEAGSVIKLDPLLVGLSAGLFLENLSPISGREVIKKTEPATMPTFAIFFAVAGAELELRDLVGALYLAVGAALVRGASLYWGSRLGYTLGRVEPVIGRRLFFGFLPQAGVSIAFSGIVRDTFPGWGPPVASFLFAVVVLNELIGPVLFRYTLIQSGEAGTRKDDSVASHAPHAPAQDAVDVYSQQVMGGGS